MELCPVRKTGVSLEQPAGGDYLPDFSQASNIFAFFGLE